VPDESAEEKTEEATPRRRQEFRERGQVARSTEINSVAVLLGGLVLLYLSAPLAYSGLSRVMTWALGKALCEPITLASAHDLVCAATVRALGAVAPVAAGMVLVAVLASYGQVGLMITPESVQPKLTKLDPAQGFKRMFSLRAVMRMAFSMLKLAIIVAVFYLAIRNRIDEFLPLVHARAGGVFSYTCHMVVMVGFQVCAVLVIIALADYGYQRWEQERKMRMTRQELREEMKRLEGDPLVKSRIRQVQREVARRRMMQELPTADVVVTNPTHYAVALRYDSATMEAPHVVAKGRDRLAQRIKEIARDHAIPFVEDPFLARALYRAAELGEPVPYALYQAVARVLAYIYQIRRRETARYVPLDVEPKLRRPAPAGA